MSSDQRQEQSRKWSRRDALKLIALSAVGLAVAACDDGGTAPAPTHSMGSDPSDRHTSPPVGQGEQGTDFSGRFASYQAADEPNGDLSKVVWPNFIKDAGSDVQSLYEFQIINGDLLKYMPCFCNCHVGDGHRNNRDCYIEAVNADGSVVFDTMAPT